MTSYKRKTQEYHLKKNHLKQIEQIHTTMEVVKESTEAVKAILESTKSELKDLVKSVEKIKQKP